MVDEQKLRQLAEAATPGEWNWVNSLTDEPFDFAAPWKGYGGPSLRTVKLYGEDKTEVRDGLHYSSFALPKWILDCEPMQNGNDEANAGLIAAANPAAILSLLDELQTLREERTAWRVTAENAEKDAARYRWIRFAALSEDQSSIFEALESANPDPKSDAEFDAAISSAMKDES